MIFYKECLEAELIIQTIGDSPLAGKMPAKMREYVLHATLVKEELTIVGSDMVGEQGLKKGNAVSIMLNCNTETEARTVYTRLAEDGQATHPLGDSFWGALFGNLTDKYGNNWLIQYNRNQ